VNLKAVLDTHEGARAPKGDQASLADPDALDIDDFDDVDGEGGGDGGGDGGGEVGGGGDGGGESGGGNGSGGGGGGGSGGDDEDDGSHHESGCASVEGGASPRDAGPAGEGAAAVEAIASSMLAARAERAAALRRAFDTIDRNGDGVLTRAEVILALRKDPALAELLPMFEKVFSCLFVRVFVCLFWPDTWSCCYHTLYAHRCVLPVVLHCALCVLCYCSVVPGDGRGREQGPGLGRVPSALPPQRGGAGPAAGVER
jgi:hypothetical protein